MRSPLNFSGPELLLYLFYILFIIKDVLSIHQNQLPISHMNDFILLSSHMSLKDKIQKGYNFLDSLEIEGSTIEEKCLKYYNLIKKGQMKKLNI